MVDIEKYKKALGESGSRLSEVEVKKLYDLHYNLANVFFDIFALKGRTDVVVSGVITTHKENGNATVCAYFGFVYTYSYVNK